MNTPEYTYEFQLLPGPGNVPLYWQQYSIDLQTAAIKFIDLEPNNLTDRELLLIKEYLLHWCLTPTFQVDNKIIVQLIASEEKEDLIDAYHELVLLNIDPF